MTTGYLPLSELIEYQTMRLLLLHFPAVIRGYRAAYALPLETFAQAAGMSQVAVSDIEDGIKTADAKQIAALLAAILRLEAVARNEGIEYVPVGDRLNRNLEAAELPGRVLTKQEREQ